MTSRETLERVRAYALRDVGTGVVRLIIHVVVSNSVCFATDARTPVHIFWRSNLFYIGPAPQFSETAAPFGRFQRENPKFQGPFSLFAPSYKTRCFNLGGFHLSPRLPQAQNALKTSVLRGVCHVRGVPPDSALRLRIGWCVARCAFLC